MQPSQSLYDTPGDRLDAFLEHSLQPQGDWKEEMQDAFQRVSKFLRDQCFRDELILDEEVRVLKVVKGGSSGKGTTLNASSDVDLVLFLSCFSSFRNQAKVRKVIISFIKKKMDHYKRSLAYNISVVVPKVKTRAPRSVSFQVQAKKSSDVISVDVLPAFDALGPFCPDEKPSLEVYENLIMSAGSPGEFSPSFTELQRHFVKTRPAKLKGLLRLVKHWYLHYVKHKHQDMPLPSKYALELLTIYAWEMGTDESDSFNMDEGLVAVMKLLMNHEDICVYWTKYYNFQNEVVANYIKKELKEPRPVILDPADPTNNLGKGKRWDLVAREAAHCLWQACCYTEDPSQGWHLQGARDVPVTVKWTRQDTWTISVNPYSPIWEMKRKIRYGTGFTGQQRLSFQEPGGDRQLLSNQQTLADYGIFSKISIRVLETFPPEIQIFVKELGGQSKPFAVYPDAFIVILKIKIALAGGPPVQNQILKFQGQKLQDNWNLRDLQIKDCDTITLENWSDDDEHHCLSEDALRREIPVLFEDRQFTSLRSAPVLYPAERSQPAKEGLP
ncbi:2'-5'-oligoadenylate synthase-like protein 2 [Rhynchocyon petersi]